MKRILRCALLAALVGALFSSSISAQDRLEDENQLAKEMAALVLFVQISNVGAQDVTCVGTPFFRVDTDTYIRKELVPVITHLKLRSTKSDEASRKEVALMLQAIAHQKIDGISNAERTYKDIKERAITAYGLDHACVSATTLIQAVIHQKRLFVTALAEVINSQ